MGSFIGLGVAGNFASHLEQAGEAHGFADMQAHSAKAPAGIFPWYVPNARHRLCTNPLSESTISIPGGVNVQAEPELLIVCDVIYKGTDVHSIIPKEFTAFNDVSLRTTKPKLSHKKNWGVNSKGIANRVLQIDKFKPGGVLDKYSLGCWLKRDGAWHEYGETSEVRTYSYFYDELLGWLVDRFNHQKDAGPLEDMNELLQLCNYPSQAYIAVGATGYTDYGKETFLSDGDEVAVVLFDASKYSGQAMERQLEDKGLLFDKELIVLRQKVFYGTTG